MSTSRRIAVRVMLYVSIAAYLIGDLLLFHGPLRQKFDSARFSASPAGHQAVDNRLVARVSGQSITRSQLDRAIATRLWLEGQVFSDLPPEDLPALRQTALDDLIDQELLRLQAKTLAPQLDVQAADVDARMKRLQGKFTSPASFITALQSQGIGGEEALRNRIISGIQQEKYIALRLAPWIRLDDAEAETWFEQHKESLSLPERIEVRHIFQPTLDQPAEQAKAKLESILGELSNNQKSFTQLAGELSEDPATQSTGGNLGWMTRERLPSDLATPLFAMELHKPALVQSKLGWHLVEITARKPAEPRTFEEAKPEILAALDAVKRQQATAALRKSLRNASLAKIEIFTDRPE